MEGSYTSRFIDAGGVVVLSNMAWTADLPSGGDLTMLARWGNDTTDLTPWKTVEKPRDIRGVTARYFQYKVLLHVYRDWFTAQLDRVIINYTVPVTHVEVSVDGGPWEDVNGTLQNWYANLTLEEGDYDIRLRGTDLKGTQVTRVIPVKVDLDPPEGSVIIEKGAEMTSSTLLHFRMEATDFHGVGEYMVSTDPTMADGMWLDFFTQGVLDWTGPDGDATIYVRFRDLAGRESPVYNDSILVDTTPPTGNVTMNGGAMYTNSLDVTLDLEWSDLTGVVAMMVSNDPNFVGVDWQDPVDSLAWQLRDGQGTSRVYVRYLDAVGWTVDFMDYIVLDRNPPMASLIIDGDVAFATSRDVVLTVSMRDMSPLTYRFANASEPWPTEWLTVPPVGPVPWELPEGPDGIREVRLQVRDAAGNRVEVGDTIALDTKRPKSSLLIDGGAKYTRDVLVRVHLEAGDATAGLEAMRVSSTEDMGNITWQSVKNAFDWSLPNGDGAKTVYVQLRDAAGLTTLVSASIILDGTSPAGSFTIGDGSDYVTDPRVTLFLEFTDAFSLADVRVSGDPLFTNTVWTSYSNAMTWALVETEGEQTVYVEVRDAAGNSVIASSSVVLDLTDPQVSVTILGDEATLDTAIEAEWSASDPLGLEAFRVSMDPNFALTLWTVLTGLPWETGGSLTLELPREDGYHKIYIQVRDVAGRVSTAEDGVWFVSGRPEGTMVLGDGSGWTRTTDIDVTLTWTEGAEATHVRFANEEGLLSSAEWSPIDDPHTHALDWGDGTKTVYAQLMEAHDISSLPIEAQIILDTGLPAITIVSERPFHLEEGKYSVDVTASDDISSAIQLHWRLDDGPWTPIENDSFLVRFESGEHTVEVRAVDIAGNEAVDPWDVTVTAIIEPTSNGWFLVIAVVVAIAACCGVGLWMLERRRRADEGSSDGGGGPS